MISIISVNYNCLKWMKLLVQAARKFASLLQEIIIVDNASEDGSVRWLENQKDIKSFLLAKNIGHGRGLDLGISQADRKFCLVLDIDAHLQRKYWGDDFLELYNSDPKIKLIAAKGGDPEGKLYNEEAAKKWITGNPRIKPIHACFQFFEREFFIDNKLSFTPRDGHDVGRKNYYDVINLGYKVLRIPAGYEDAESKEKLYKGAWGDEYYINSEPMIYHNWYSARMWKKEKVDNLTREEFERREKIVFEQPLVKKILSYRNKVYWVDKEKHFIWTHCPVCGKVSVISLKWNNWVLSPEDGKHIVELTETIFYPKTVTGYERGCEPGVWHISLENHTQELRDA